MERLGPDSSNLAIIRNKERKNGEAVDQIVPNKTRKPVAPNIPPAAKAAVISAYATGDSIREIARKNNLARQTVTNIVNAIRPTHEALIEQALDETKEFYKAAIESYLYALREETDGRLASEFLKSTGVLKDPRIRVQLSKTPEEDKRTPAERAMDAKKKALTDLMNIAVDRAEAFGSPIDTQSEKAVAEYVIELHPVEEEKD
jgi:lambda repressor-like predicted transcriptional regulator